MRSGSIIFLMLAFVVVMFSVKVRAAEHEDAHVRKMDFCSLFSDGDLFDGKVVEVQAVLVIEPHGRHLFGEKCSELGDMGLAISDHDLDKKSVSSLLRFTMKSGGSSNVVLIGSFENHQAQGFHAILNLRKVVRFAAVGKMGEGTEHD